MSYMYDKRGNRTEETVMGDESYTMTNTYDLNNRLTNQTKSDSNGAVEGYQLKKITMQGSDKTVTEKYTLTGDKKNIESKEVYDFDGTTLREKTTYTYNADGTLQNSIVCNVTNGEVSGEISKVEYDYTDNKGRTNVNGKSFDGLNITETTVTNNKKVSSAGEVQDVNEVVTESFIYDDYGNLLSDTNANGETTSYEYYVDNKVKKITNPDVYRSQ